MILNDSPIERRPQGHLIRFGIVSVLALVALVLGLFAVHSAGAGVGHEMAVAAPGAAAHAGHVEHVTGAQGMVAGAVAAVAVSASTVSASTVSASSAGASSAGGDFMAGCGILGMTCAVLLIVVALIRMARQPSAYRRLPNARGFVVLSFRTIPLHVHRPSLILLSISRI